jgi:hypothetical protein
MFYRFLFCLSAATHARRMPVPYGAEWFVFSVLAGSGVGVLALLAG